MNQSFVVSVIDYLSIQETFDYWKEANKRNFSAVSIKESVEDSRDVRRGIDYYTVI